MATRPKQSIAEQLTAAQMAISNTRAEAEIRAVMEQYGYGPERIEEGWTLYVAASRTFNAQAVAAGAQRDATQSVKDAQAQARDAYQALAQVARAVFVADKDRLAALGVTGRMPATTAGFLTSGYRLFENALAVEDIKTALTGYGYDEAKLQAERARLVAFDQANQTQEAAKGAARQATQEAEAALRSLQTWMSQFVKIAKVALRDKRQLLEKLGIAVRTTKTPAQRAAPQKAAATRAAKKAE